MKLSFGLVLVVGLGVLNGALLLHNFGLGETDHKVPSGGLRSEWLEIEKPWLPVPKPVAKIDLQAGQAQLQKALDTATVEAAKPLVTQECKRWGPFLLTEAQRIAQALQGWQGSVQRQSKPVVTGFVVYIPPAVVSTGVTLETLRAKGVREMLVIGNPGSLQGSISLGLFREEDQAREHQTQMLALGVPGVAVRERFGPERVFFELRGSANHMQTLGRIYEQTPRGQLLACERE